MGCRVGSGLDPVRRTVCLELRKKEERGDDEERVRENRPDVSSKDGPERL